MVEIVFIDYKPLQIITKHEKIIKEISLLGRQTQVCYTET